MRMGSFNDSILLLETRGPEDLSPQCTPTP